MRSARLDRRDHRGDDDLRHRGDNAVLARSASMQNRIAMYNGNALKIGLFGANCSSGRSATKVPER
jgi:hypothetical protein